MEPFLTVYGHVAIDQILTVDEYPKPNTSIDVLSKITKLGGTASNIAVNAARLDVPTALSAFVGSDFPIEFRNLIEESGTDTEELVDMEGYETSQAVVVNDSHMVQKVLYYQGPQGSASKLGKVYTEKASKSKYVHLATGDPHYYLKFIPDIKAKKVLDPAQEIHRIWTSELLRKAMESSDFLFCNEFEFETAKKYLGAKSIKDIDLPLVVCTLGSRGSTALIDGEVFDIPTVKADRVVDATGAGDSYRAGFYAGLYRGYGVLESLIIGSAMSSFVVEVMGAMTARPSWDDVMARAEPYLKKI